MVSLRLKDVGMTKKKESLMDGADDMDTKGVDEDAEELTNGYRK